MRMQLEAKGCKAQIRTTTLGHIQRGGTPIAFDRILATAMGAKAYHMVKKQEFGKMVSYRKHKLESVSLKEATEKYNHIHKDNYLLKIARSIGISFGD